MLVGANPDELDQVAERFRQAAAKLGPLHADVLREIRSSAWAGNDADHFEQAWRQRGRSTLDRTAELLASAASTLTRNAADQRTTSAADTAWVLGTGPGGSPGTPVPTQDDKDWARQDGRDQARGLAGATPEAQLEWWRSLTPEQRQALLAGQPTALLALGGLPPDVRAAAQRNAVEAMRKTVTVNSVQAKVSGNVTVEFIRVGADIEAQRKVFADGHVELTLTGGLEGGVAGGAQQLEGSAVLRGQLGVTYEFASGAEADKFLRELMGAAKPDSVGDVFRAASPASYAAKEVGEVLGRHKDDFKEVVGAVELKGTAKVQVPGVGSVEVKGSAGAEHNFTDHTTTAYVSLSGEGQTDIGVFNGAASGDAKVGVTFDENGQLTKLKVEGTFSTQETAGGGVPEVFKAKAGVGAGGAFTAELDLTDPANRAVAYDLLTASATHDPVAQAAAFARMTDASQVTVQTTAVASTKVEAGGTYGGVGIEGSFETKGTQAVTTFVKPAHGDLALLEPKSPVTAGSGSGERRGGGGSW